MALPEVWVNLASLYVAQGNPGRAAELYKSANARLYRDTNAQARAAAAVEGARGGDRGAANRRAAPPAPLPPSPLTRRRRPPSCRCPPRAP